MVQAALILENLGRFEEGIVDEMRFETDGKISLWLFRETADEDLDDDILKTQFGITTYDEDMLEVGGSDEWKMTPLRKVFEPMSYSASWVEDALASAKELGIKKCRRAFFILNFAYDPQKVQNPLPADPVLSEYLITQMTTDFSRVL